MGARFVLVLFAASLVLAPAHASGERATLHDVLRAEVAAAAVAHGIAPEDALAAPFELVVDHADGTVSRETLTLDEMLRRVGGARVVPGDAPAASAGDVLHAYANIAVGSALAYRVTTSTVAPSTPPVMLAPQPFDVGGPLRNVKGSYLIGAHGAGTTFGSNVDTSDGGPYLPLVDGAMVTDRAIDFAGHATVAQGQACIFGLCFASGALLGTGAAAWDGSAPAALPVAP